MRRRSWPKEDIQKTVDQPHKTAGTTDRRGYTDGGDKPDTAYFDEDGNCIVVNNRTGSIVQVSKKLYWSTTS